MSPRNGMNIEEQVVSLLQETGHPMKVKDMTETIKYKYKSVYGKCLELVHKGALDQNPDGTWSLRPGVTLETFKSGALQPGGSPGGGPAAGAGLPAAQATPAGPTVPGAAGQSLDQRQMFMSHLVGIGVTPKEAIPTICEIFFSGDIDSLPWLNQVLTREAAGFVAPNQKRTILSWWSHTRGLPYNEEDYPVEGAEAPAGKKGAAKEPAKPSPMDVAAKAGIGYKIDCDPQGRWKAVPGGPMTYQEAVEAAERRAAIEVMAGGGMTAAAEAAEDSGEGRPAAKGGKAARPFQEILMEKMLDHFLDGNKGRGDEDSPVLKELRQQNQTLMATVEQMRDDREQERFDRMEANIAALAARDPFGDPGELARLRQALGVQTSNITDSSPAVQIIKDASQRMDKNMDRMTGIIERIVLKSDEFRPEETRSPEEKEEKAGALLNAAQARSRSKELRMRTFGT